MPKVINKGIIIIIMKSCCSRPKKNHTRSYSGPGISEKTKETEVII